ncbi:MAG: hypothetical protein A2V70_14405 [Planctomycetes bacterium RBG_13_63_9]|nr:MAG: hypothetical protein A2V70_14405 [Planctomycetes bacterium RBG_13_63_9]
MATFEAACPNCGTTFTVDEAHRGKKGRCKRCGKDFILPSQDEHSPASASVISISCPSCRRKFDVSAIHVGRNAKCAKCGTRFQIESTAAVAAPAAETQQPLPETPSAAKAGASAEEDVPLEWNPGDVILDLYEVMGVLGEGGMGKVYKVHHRGWNLDLAVKCPKPDKFATNAQKETFERECETWIDLGLHPHIVSCYYVRRLGEVPRVFAEYVEGGSLKDWIEDRRLYEDGPEEALKRILDIAIQLAWGLQYAHEHGLIHQDVKPANVMMTSDGTAKVTGGGAELPDTPNA